MTDPQIIKVSGYEKFDLFDDFDGHCENVVFDQTAKGARARLEARGNGDWTIRNVAFKGSVDDSTSYTDSAQIKPAVHNEDGTGVIENVYLGDGTVDGTEMNGILVDYRHAGTLIFKHCHVAQWSDNGMYCSDAGYYSASSFEPDGGTVHIRECYATHNNITQFRIGSEGSTVEDSVAVVTDMNKVPVHANGGHNARGVRMHHTENNECINCDITATGVGHAVQAKDGGGGTLTDCRVEGSISDKEGPINDNGIGDNPTVEPPQGVPMTADDVFTDGGEDTEPEPTGTAFEVLTPQGGDAIEYTFTADGPVYKHQTEGNVWAGGNDEITKNDDGTVTVSGYTGNGYGDAYLVDGSVTSWEDNGAEFSLTWDGADVTVDALVGGTDDTENELVLAVRASKTNDGPIDVGFLIEGKLTYGDTTQTSGGTTMTDVDDTTIEVVATDLGPGEYVEWGYVGEVTAVDAPDGATMQVTTDAENAPLAPEGVDEAFVTEYVDDALATHVSDHHGDDTFSDAEVDTLTSRVLDRLSNVWSMRK